MDGWRKVRIKGTGQVTELAPAVAFNLIARGLAEDYSDAPIVEKAVLSAPETATVEAGEATQLPKPETAVAHIEHVRKAKARGGRQKQ